PGPQPHEGIEQPAHLGKPRSAQRTHQNIEARNHARELLMQSPVERTGLGTLRARRANTLRLQANAERTDRFGQGEQVTQLQEVAPKVYVYQVRPFVAQRLASLEGIPANE